MVLALALGHSVARDSTRLWLLVIAVGSGPLTCAGLLWLAHRMRDQRARQAHETYYAQHDELTGLPNRTGLRARLVDARRTAAEHHAELTCLYLDLDGLRFANALLGYQAGDKLLQEIVARVSGCLGPTDHFSRFGGDKFVVLLQRTLSRAETDTLANAIIHTVGAPANPERATVYRRRQHRHRPFSCGRAH